MSRVRPVGFSCRRWFAAVVLFALALAWPVWAWGQAAQAQAEDDQAQPGLTLDVERMVFESSSLRMNDPVWSVKAQPGRQVVLVPLRVGAVTESLELTRSPVKVRMGRFIGFYLPEDSRPQSGAFASRGGGDVDRSELAGVDDAGFASLLLKAVGLEASAEAGETTEDTEQKSDEAAPEVSDSAPRLARNIVLHPDGRVSWSMDRSFAGGELNRPTAQRLYPYKLSAELLREAQPPRPERLTRSANEDSRAFAERRRAQQLRDRELQTTYRELRDRVRALPEAFSLSAPQVVYAVFDAPVRDGVELEGGAAMPWSIDEASMKRYANLAQADPNRAGSEAVIEQSAQRAAEHPLDARAAAFAVVRGGLVNKAEPGDALSELLGALIGSSDEATARLVTLAAAVADPPTPVTIQLLSQAGERTRGELRQAVLLAELRARLALDRTQLSEPGDLALLAKRIDALLADPQGPDAIMVVRMLLSSDSGPGRTADSQAAVSRAAALIQGVSFDALKADAAASVIDAIIDAAPVQPIAAGWLGQQLMSPASKHLLPTLAAIQRDRPEPIAPTDQTDPAETNDSDQLALPTGAPLSASLPIRSAKHGLIPALTSAQPAVRDAAWLIVDRFVIDLQSAAANGNAALPAAGQQQPEVSEAMRVYRAILDAAAKQPQTPVAIVGFIEAQQQAELKRAAGESMLDLLAGDAIALAVKRKIADRMSGDEPGGMNQAWKSVDPETRVFAYEALYLAADQTSPGAVGLIADANSPHLSWALQQAAQQQMPDAEAWTQQVADSPRAGGTLLQLAAGDQPLVARGAAAALVSSFGGTIAEQQRFGDVIEQIQDKSAESLESVWSGYKSQVQAKRFAQAAGAYRVVVTLLEPAKPAPPADPAPADAAAKSPEPEALEQVNAGLVELRAAGIDLSLSIDAIAIAPHPDRLGIRIADPATIETLDKPSLESLGLAQIRGPIDLLPAPGDAWVCETQRADGKTIRIRLVPAD